MAGRASRFWPVGAILAAFVRQGCEVRIAEATMPLPDGDSLSLRYLRRPDTGDFVALVDLADDDQVAESEVAFWEQRLGVGIERPAPN